jgi:ferredoxin
MMIRINQELCTACGICGHVCPRHIPETHTKITVISPERIDLCLQCGHCVAVCPKRAITVGSLSDEQFTPAKELDIGDDQLLALMKQRRSVRRYKDTPVPRDMLQRIIEAAFSDLIPPACNKVPEIRKLLSLPDEREVYASITMGYSKYQFKRIPPRKLAEVRYI